MHLQELRLQNFRCFTDATISFDERLTVLVGKNGSGKTAILDAAACFLNQIVEVYMEGENFTKFFLDKRKDRNIETAENLKMSLTLQHNGVPTTLQEPEDSNTITYGLRPGMPGFTKLPNEKVSKILLPEDDRYIISYYNSGRLSFQLDDKHIQDDQGVKSAYRYCLAPWLSWNATIEWIDRHDAYEARQFRDGNKNFRDLELSAMREAVKDALPDFENLSFDGLKSEVTVTRKTDGQKLSFWQLSDGYRAMLALILDLARRMAIANGERYTAEGRSILSSPAIVLIDEIELHLHPGWQQTVLPSLLEIFPNTQFIVSTHSPQVLSSIASKHIRLLDEGEVYAAPEGTEGAESSRILKRIFGVLPRPPKNKFAEALARYQTLVEADQWDSDEAKQLRATLDANFQGQEPALQEADLYIENRKWELADEEN